MTIDADAEKVLAMIRAAGRPTLDTLTPAEARDAYRQARRALSPDPIDIAEVPRSRGGVGAADAIPLRLYRGIGAPPAGSPCLIYIHGGGWVIGDLDTHDGVCRKLANESRGVVISVAYRLAPEHKFPIPLDDCAAAVRWIAAQASALGIDATRLAIGGDSAGGNLSAVLCLMARDGDGPKLIYQLLLYPGADMTGDYTERTRRENSSLPLTNTVTRWFRDQYLPSLTDSTDWRASPLRAASHAGLPPAFVLTAHYDPIGEEGRAYARALQAAGVRVWHIDLSDQVHGFLTMGRVVRAADTALEMAGAALRYAYTTAAG